MGVSLHHKHVFPMNELALRMAIEAITAELSASPSQPHLLKERGRLLMILGDKAAAMADLREALRLDPTIVSDLHNGSFEGEIKGCH